MKHLAPAFRWIAVVALAASVLAVPPGVPPAHALTAIWRVAPGGLTSGACGDTWTAACDLQYALSLAQASGGQVWVKEGTYTPTGGSDRSIRFVPADGVAIYGGFIGVDDAETLDDRDPGIHVTTLSGNIGDDTIATDNSYNVVSANGVGRTAVLDGFTITGGYANGSTEATYAGAGIHLASASPTLANLTVTGNFASDGGGIFANAGSPLLSNVVISSNTANAGGGMLIVGAPGTPQLTLNEVDIEDNQATVRGGGLAVLLSNPTLQLVSIEGNNAQYAGGLFLFQSNAALTDTTFYDNLASNGNGGGVLAACSSPSLERVTLTENSASANGGGFSNEGGTTGCGPGTPSLTNVTFNMNRADKGGGFYNLAANSSLTNVSMASNYVYSSGTDMYIEGGTPTIHNSILWSSDPFGYPGAGASATITDSMISGGCPTGATCTNHVNGDPLLQALADNGGPTQTLALGFGSAAENALTAPSTACPAVDQRGVSRPQGPACDVGAYEVTDTLCYVNDNAVGASTGESWTDAYTDLQSALTGDCATVWVAAGLYTPGTSESNSFAIRPGTEVYGGFDGVDDIFTDRDPDANVTILSGDITDNDLDGVGAHIDVITNVSQIVTPNSDHVVTMGGLIDERTVLDGFTITAGEADGDAPFDAGAGLFCDASVSGEECSPVLGNLVFSGNDALIHGGAIYMQAAESGAGRGVVSPSISHSTFTANAAGIKGGAIYFLTGGSGIDSAPALSDVQFLNNSAGNAGGAMSSIGDDGQTNPTISGATFAGNTAAGGGAVYVAGGGGLGGNVDLTVTDAYFLHNFASSAGGALWQQSSGADNDGAGSTVSMRNTVLSGNDSDGPGGALYLWAFIDGGGVGEPSAEDARAYMHLDNVSMSHNTASAGGALYVHAAAGSAAHASVANSILWGDWDTGDADEIKLYEYGEASTSYSDIMGGCPIGADCSEGGNIQAEPFFVDATNDDLRLQDNSPAIDAGNKYRLPDGITTDLDGNDRFVDLPGVRNSGAGTPPIDMGAYEYQLVCPTGPVIFVDEDATGSGSGNSWTDAYTDLAEALQAGALCSGASEFWVAEGVYLPGSYDASDTFRIMDGMEVYGGFDGAETERNERDVKANVTILSGDIDGDDDNDNADGNFIAEDAGEIVGENPYHVVTIDGSDVALPADTVLDGFTITGGYAVGVWKDGFGGGLYCFGASDALCSPTLQNLVFSGNYAAEGGGAIANDGQGGDSSPVINNVTFVGNWAGTLHLPVIGGGGAIINFGEANDEGIGKSSPKITNSTFLANKAKLYGGAIYNDGNHEGESSPIVANSTFAGNETSHYGGAVFNHAWDAGTTEATYENVTFSGNSATYGGGSLATDDFEGGSANVTVTNAIFWGGSALNGPEINSAGSTTISHSVIQDAYDDLGTWQIDATEGTGNTEANPQLAAPADNGGPTQTMALLPGSSAIDAGDDATCADPNTVNGLDQRGVVRPRGPHCDIGAFELEATTATFTSQGLYDGYVLESSETSSAGGTLNSTLRTFNLGDSEQRSQYRSILTFGTASLPDNAVITSARLTLRRYSVTGFNPFFTLGRIWVDIRTGTFGARALEISDFNSAPSRYNVASFTNNAHLGAYTAILSSDAFSYLNKTGLTQLRLRFWIDDDNDNVADYLKFYSGDHPTAVLRPTLVVEYYLP